MIVEYTAAFDRMYLELEARLQVGAKSTIRTFLERFEGKQFPKGLRVHKCGPLISLSVDMSHRIYLMPIPGGIRFVFVGDHQAAERYLKNS